jgi:mRNA-degrading endonuclease RelE of RelBE toxin-antitoxin system
LFDLKYVIDVLIPYTVSLDMVIIETSVFTKLVLSQMSDEEYRQLQIMLCVLPDTGDLIPGSGGLRKVRWGHQGKGKKGGLRVIYYWVKEPGKILMLYLYKKNKQSDLTPNQLKTLKQVVEEEFL